MRWLLMLLLCAPLGAQSFDEAGSRFLSAPHGRTGCWAPYRVVLTGLDGLDTVTVRSVAPGVTLERQVPVAGAARAEVILPVFVHGDSRLEAGDAVHTPVMPVRRVQPDFARSYTAVFSADPVYARGVMPSSPTGATCDYFELREFFTDWRLFDGYDAIVIFNPGETRLPPGSQRAIAEFCSLGGAVLIVGSFRLGEQVSDLPAPAEPTLETFRGVGMQRYGYGAGAIYRVGFEELRASREAHSVIETALRDHLWFAGARSPAGTPESRIPPARVPHPDALPMPEAAPTLLFWALAGGLLLVCGLVPPVAARLTRRRWVPGAAVLAGCLSVGGAGLLQESPLPVLEVFTVILTGEGDAASARMLVQAAPEWGDTWTIDLDDAGVRDLPRRSPAQSGMRAWVVDRPLTARGRDHAPPIRLSAGRVDGQTFRDFATAVHRGQMDFPVDAGNPLEWWLDSNAYRGRQTEIAPLEWSSSGLSPGSARVLERGAIRITPLRDQPGG
jgi:hypothetical protein